jgi:predicted GTPase
LKISVEKLVANRANAQKSSGPQARAGKLRSSKNALKHGLGARSSNPSQNPSLLNHYPELKSYQQELISLGYSDAQSQEIIEALLTVRQVAEVKHSAYKDRLNEDRLADMTPEAVASFVREMEDPLSTVTPMERARVVALLFKQVQKDNDLSGLLFEKFEAHRKLMRYEQRAFNQLRKKSLV